jgi:hypothetical protein
MKKWSPTHLQPAEVPCCQRSDNHPGCRDEKELDGNLVYQGAAKNIGDPRGGWVGSEVKKGPGSDLLFQYFLWCF